MVAFKIITLYTLPCLLFTCHLTNVLAAHVSKVHFTVVFFFVTFLLFVQYDYVHPFMQVPVLRSCQAGHLLLVTTCSMSILREFLVVIALSVGISSS